ncbi:DUF7550 family protein [Halapricum salinum]|uniref:Uncharacterized protein n=1 Tax=Halapricum salinum TaxID=1457250 RepID=A0A4D6H861_9EURY|nr:hypothetical protein [Halapricum salinum]QCC50204.1 hypothetical protein DV733_02690 [Halapricum salinum]
MADEHETTDGEQEHDTTHDHHDEHDHGADRPDYDPENVELPSREPPLRSTAPQSDFTMRQVLTGVVVLAIGLAVVFGIPLALA